MYVSYSSSQDSGIIFTYPDEAISFGGEDILMTGSQTDNKKRFDKEFLLSSNNLYQFYLYVKRWPLYNEYIDEMLNEYEIHSDFRYLPIAESALRNDVVSSAWAWWIWQFMPETAKRYGLVVDEYVDERYHFEKSTKAAMKYLSDLHEDFWDWALVAAAYNRWENGLKRDMKAQWVDNYYDLYLNEETSRYVFRITAIKYAMLSYFEKKSIVDKLIGGVYKKPETTLVQVWSIDDLKVWSQDKEYNYKDIKNLNRWIIWDTLPEWEWEIYILES